MTTRPTERTFRGNTYVVLIVMFLAADTSVQIAFKIAGDHLGNGDLDFAWLKAAVSSPLVWIGIVLYFSVFVLWMQIIRRVELSRAFPLTSLTYVTVPALGMMFFNETLSITTAMGIVLILAGVLLVGQRD